MIEKIYWNGILYSMFATFGISGLCELNAFTKQLILSMNQFAFVASCFVIGFGISIYKHRRG